MNAVDRMNARLRALLGEPAGASATGQARTVSIPVPIAGDMIVARIDLRTAGSGSAASRLPKLRFLNAAGLPDEVTVVGGVARDPKRRDRAIASGYFLPGFFNPNTLRVELTLSGPAGSVQVLGQQADGAWEPFPVSPTGG